MSKSIGSCQWSANSMKNITLICCALNAIFLGRCAILPLLKPFADNLDSNLGNFEQTLLFGIFYITMGISAFALQALAQRYTCRNITILSCIGMSGAFLFQALSQNFWVLVTARCVTGLFAGLRPVVVTYFRYAASFDLTPSKCEARYNEILGFWIGIAFFLGPLCNIGFVAKPNIHRCQAFG